MLASIEVCFRNTIITYHVQLLSNLVSGFGKAEIVSGFWTVISAAAAKMAWK